MDSVFDALANPGRRQVLLLLREGPAQPGAIATRLGIGASTLSAHLAKLRDAGLIHADKRGASITYTLKTTVLEEVLLGLLERLRDEPAGDEECAKT